MLSLLSPRAPSFEQRLESVRALSRNGVKTSVRLDPFFPHLARALYGEKWTERVKWLIDQCADAGVRHIISSTGRLSKQRSRERQDRSSILTRIKGLIENLSREQALRFEEEYCFSNEYTSKGYLLERGQRLGFHLLARRFAEGRSMTYATCQETHAEETDSEDIPHCEGFTLPFTRKASDGKFYPVVGCTANCHASCRDLPSPPCGKPLLVSPSPLKKRLLK